MKGQASRLRKSSGKHDGAERGEQDDVIKREAKHDITAMASVGGVWTWTARWKGAKQCW